MGVSLLAVVVVVLVVVVFEGAWSCALLRLVARVWDFDDGGVRVYFVVIRV